jgi:hypothetical protein
MHRPRRKKTQQSETVRYFFHARRGKATFDDTEGSGFPTAKAAAAHAEIVAMELSVGGRWQGTWVLVVDETGREIARVQVPPPL